MGGLPISELCGIVVGHLYFFLADVYPAQGGPRLISTPQLLREWFPGLNARPPRPGDGPRNPGHNWGMGFALGAGGPQ